MVDRSGSTTRRRRTYRWWQWALRGGAVGALVLVGLYAVLPLWLPTGWVARRLEADLTEQLGSPVTVGDVSISWSEGVRIASISVADPAGVSDVPLLTTGMIRADFSPLRLLLASRIEWMQIESPTIRLASDESGRWNVASLRPPALRVRIGRISIRRGIVRLALDGEADPLRLEISDLQCRAGRRWPIAEVSGSIALVHGSHRAPLGLSITVSHTPAGSPRPVLKCSFSGLDLADLDLIGRLGLPLSKMEGVCEGSLSLPVADGTISRATASLTVDRLVVQPTVGPGLPMIQTAGVRLVGDVDLATRQVHVRSLALRGPGIELAGEARFHASLLEGLWLSGQTLSVTGTVNPRAVATVIRGAERPALDPYEVAGDVQLNIAYQRHDDEIEATLNVDATAATVAAADDVIKPVGDALRCSLSVQCRPQTWQFVVDRTELQWGGNRLIGRGALSNVRRLLLEWAGPDHDWTVQEVGEELANLDWYAEWDITELDSLKRLGPIAKRTLGPAALTGRITGVGRLDHTQGVRLRVDMACDDDTQLRVGEWFAKPSATALAATADLTYNQRTGRMGESVLRLTCGDGQASVRLTDAVFTSPGERGRGPMGGWVADVRGTAHVDQIEQFAACFGATVGLAERMSGAASGEFAVDADDDALRIVSAIDATPLRIRAGDVVGKSPGEPVTLTCNTLWQWPRGGIRSQYEAVMPGAELTGHWVSQADRWAARTHLAVSDAAWLAEQIPWLGRDDTPLRLEGAADLRVDLDGRGDVIAAEGDIAADELSLMWLAGARWKRPGVPLRATVMATLDRAAHTPIGRLDISDATVVVAGASVHGAGSLLPADRAEDVSVDLAARWTFSLAEPMRSILPELDEWTDAFALTGIARGRCHVQGTAASMQIDGHADGADLAAAVTLGSSTIRKPTGVPAALTWSAAFSDAFSKVTISDWTARLGPVRAIGDGRLARPPGGAAADVSATSHVRLWTAGPDRLAALYPDLADRHPAGFAQIEGQVVYEAGRVDLPYVRVMLDDLSFMHRGRRVTLDGMATAGEIGLAPVGIGRFSTDGITAAVADSGATLIADLHDLPAAPRGSVAVNGELIDITDLRTWLTGSAQLPEPTPEYTRRLVEAATAAVDAARHVGADADVTVAADFDLIRDFPDDKVRQVYDAHNVTLRARLNAGQVSAQYTAGVNGGTLIDQFETDLTTPEPRLRHVNTIREMMATASLQPQITAFFPGNEVRGTMWREMDLQRDLVDTLVSLGDPTHPAPPSGWGKTTLIDGITRGRASPLYVTRLFPGLNLVEYPYERMVAFTDFFPDGTAYNDMVFTGKTYNMYIEGTTDADQIAHYDVGIILGPTRHSAEWHHRYRQGRIPLLQHKLRIVDGTKADEEVSYPWPNESMFQIFVRNNYFYRLWLQRQQEDDDAK